VIFIIRHLVGVTNGHQL